MQHRVRAAQQNDLSGEVMTERCCICMRSVEEDRVILIQFPKGPKARHEHFREAVAQSDCVQPTEGEWQEITRRLIFELEDLATENRGGKP